MALKYRKISPCIWNDAKVRELSDKGKLALLFLLTHPHMTALGAIRANCPGLGCELGWTARSFRKAFTEILSAGIAYEDAKATLIWFPNFLKYNLPESPNVVRAWAGGFEDLPECALKDDVLQGASRLVARLSEGFQEAFREAFSEGFQEASGEALAKAMPNQEQEQEQEKKGGEGAGVREAEAHEAPSLVSVATERPKKTDSPSKGNPQWTAFLSCWQVYPVQQGKEEAWREWMRQYENRTLAESYAIRDTILLLMAEDTRWSRGKVPKMAKWLAGKGWEDQPYVEPNAAGSGAGSPMTPQQFKTAKMAESEGRGRFAGNVLAMMNARELEEQEKKNGIISRHCGGIGQDLCALSATGTGQHGI